jgi:hypothetical protein
MRGSARSKASEKRPMDGRICKVVEWSCWNSGLESVYDGPNVLMPMAGCTFQGGIQIMNGNVGEGPTTLHTLLFCLR